jgi:hypothetical protein
MDIGPGRSAKQAIAVTRKRCWQYDWVVEFDIKAAFDQIDHGLLLKAVRTHIREGWILLYVERWLTAPFETAEGEQLLRERGTPQGGVVGCGCCPCSTRSLTSLDASSIHIPRAATRWTALLLSPAPEYGSELPHHRQSGQTDIADCFASSKYRTHNA